MIYCRLTTLKKCPGVRPIWIGDIFRKLVCKVFLSVTGKEATRACGMGQLCSGLDTGIEGGIHYERSLWKENSENEGPWRVLLIDAHNVFNERNRKIVM